MMRSLVLAAGPLVLTIAVWTAGVGLLSAADEPQVEGVDVVQAVKDLHHALAKPESSVGKGHPWEEDIAALTDSRPALHNAAIAALIRRGAVVLPDLRVLSGDQDWQVRVRVSEVAAGIGGEDGTALVLALSRDPDKRVAELSTLYLGQAHGSQAFARLAEQLGSPDVALRQAAARGLGALGDARALAPLSGYGRERDDLVQRDMRQALERVAQQVASVPVLGGLLAERSGDERLALVEACDAIGDPRLCLPLTALLAAPDQHLGARAARALAANGDSRAIAALCQASSSAGTGELRAEAAATLQRLTSYAAAAGPAWGLWWGNHAAEVERLIPRDRFIAELHDPARAVDRAELTHFTVEELWPLIDGALGGGAPWWPARAFAVLRLDDAARWTAPLLARIVATADPNPRLALIVFLDQLGDPKAAVGLRRLYDQPAKGDAAPTLADGAERIALRIALERRGVTVH